VAFGSTALDIGARDGRYVPVIRELGFTSIMAIDPSIDELREGVSHGIVGTDEVFGGKLEDWVNIQETPADSAFIFNVNPSLPSSPDFIAALVRAVKPGGLIVASFVEFSTAKKFAAATTWRNLTRPVSKRPKPTSKSSEFVIDKQLYNDESSQINGWLSLLFREPS
jgi:hypothetical protein